MTEHFNLNEIRETDVCAWAEQTFDPDRKLSEVLGPETGAQEHEQAEKNDVPEQKEQTDAAERYCSTSKERIDRTPRADSPRGEWTGDRGDSVFIPTDPDMVDTLKEYGMEGVRYEDGVVDFSPCAEATVEIDSMSEQRYGRGGNFEQADTKCAEQWNDAAKGGKTDWTPRDVANWRAENNYSWHERNDMKTCDLVLTKINDYFDHLGGVSECRKRDAETTFGGDFDD